MRAPIDITGFVSGNLTAICCVGTNKWGQRLWRCECLCGGHINEVTARIKSKITRSCGCISKIKNYNNDPVKISEVRERKLFLLCKNRAEHRNLKFELTQAEHTELSFSPCTYCGTPPMNQWKDTNRKTRWDSLSYTGIDRVDNTLGYISGNVVPCCKDCNFAKSARTVAEFTNWILKAAAHLSSKGDIKIAS